MTTSDGTAEDQISEITGEIKDGSITIGDIVWQGDGTAKVTVTTDITEPECYIEYKVGADGDSWTRIDNGEEITLQLNDEVYARVTDGTNTFADAYRKISDNANPTVSVTKTGEATSNSIAVSVTATDAESGMKEGTTYTYYIKESSQADTDYEAKATDVTDTSYTFTELKQNTSYDIKVEVNGDRAGNKGEDTLLNQQTKEVAGASDGLREGSIVATAPSWSNGQASITLTTDTGLKIQYQKNGIDGTWTTINSGGQVTELNHNDTVYARLWDGTNAGASASVEIRDTGKPIINSITTSNITSNSITVTVDATDNETGLAISDTYTYYLNGGAVKTSTSNIYDYTDLSAETKYTLKVLVKDKAGISTEKSVDITTAPTPTVSTIKEGTYVNYVDKNGVTRQCMVLYDSSSKYGVQIITMQTVEDIILGDWNNLDKVRTDYNNVIKTLNEISEKYLNTTYASIARSVGTVPDNPYYDGAKMFTKSDSYFSEYNGTFKDQDNNYIEDWEQMKKLGIKSSGAFWLPSRYTGGGTNFAIYRHNGRGMMGTQFLCNILSNGDVSLYRYSAGIRPVFTLKPEVKITGGNGTESSPYTLGV